MISHCAGGIVIDSSKRKVAGMSSVPNFLDCFGSATLVPQYYSASVYATCTPVFWYKSDLTIHRTGKSETSSIIM